MKDALTKLAALYSANEGISHWAVSYRFLGKGDFFARLMQGSDCKTATYQRILESFSEHWPADLEWPCDIPRPTAGSVSSSHIKPTRRPPLQPGGTMAAAPKQRTTA